MYVISKQLSMVMLGFLLAATPVMEIHNTVIAVTNVIELPSKKIKQINNTDIRCMAENIYYEAGTQSYAGKMAVGLVVLNRTASKAYPSSVCAVIHQESNDICQFSWACDTLRNDINEESRAWRQSVKLAKMLLSAGKSGVLDITDGSLYFHTTAVAPTWSRIKVRTVLIDDHIFYK